MNNPKSRAAAVDILAKVVAVGRNAAVYPHKHPMVMEPAEEIVKLLKASWDDQPLITFHIVNAGLYFQTQLLPEETIKYSQFIRFLSDRGINNFSIHHNATSEAIARFFSILAEDRSKIPDKQELRKRIEGEKIAGIEFDSLIALDLMENVYDLVKKESSPVAADSYRQAMGNLEAFERDIAANAPVLDIRSLQASVSSLIEDFLRDHDAILGIMSIKNYDRYLFDHSINVAITALLIASKLSLSEEQMRIVGVSGLLHDLGKLKIPHEIITKPTKLTEGEWSIIRRHPIEGAQMLMRYEGMGELPVLAALEHHAGYDLSGYPSLKGKKRPHLLSRIIGIADVYEAMTANRSYRPAQTLDRAVKVIVGGAGAQFDPLLVKLLLNIIGVFPPGSIVRLKNGAAAVVVEPIEDNPFFPKVRIVEDFSQTSGASLVNTADDPSQYAVVGVAEYDKI